MGSTWHRKRTCVRKFAGKGMNELTTNKLGDMWEFMIYGNYSPVRDSFLGDSVKTNSRELWVVCSWLNKFIFIDVNGK